MTPPTTALAEQLELAAKIVRENLPWEWRRYPEDSWREQGQRVLTMLNNGNEIRLKPSPQPEPEPAKAEWVPRFKVGDRVKIIKPMFPSQEKPQTITRLMCERGRYGISGCDYTTWPEDALEPYTEPLPWVVA